MFCHYNDTKKLFIDNGIQTIFRSNLQSTLHKMVGAWLVIDKC